MPLSLIRAALLALLALLTSLPACSPHTAPRIEVSSVGITEQTVEGVVVTFRLAAENRNADPLPLRNVTYSLSLEGKEVFSGKRSAETTLRRYAIQEFTLPVALSLGDGADLPTVPTGQLPYSFSGSVEYELPGSIAEVLFDTGLRRTSAAFAEEGNLDFTTANPAP